MLLCQDRHHVGPDLISGIAVGRNAIGAHHYTINFALLHHMTGHVVRDDGDGNIILREFPSGQASAL